ncbi:hypothetical protein DV735_g2995, partial [Chaetothyriales sp. CBS 134920]
MSIPESQKALIIQSKGSRVVATTRPVPSPGANEVLIRVSGSGLNPHDQLIRDLGIIIQAFPWIPANDLAGTVVKLGPGVTKYAVGDRIFGQSDLHAKVPLDHNGAQEYALLRVEASAKIPASLLKDSSRGSGHSSNGDDAALTLPTNFVAAFWALHDDTGHNLPVPALGLKGNGQEFDFSKHDLLIVGGGGRVGQQAVQIANRLDGWRKIVVVAGKRNEEALLKLGATHVIDRSLPVDEQLKQIRAIVGDDLVYAIDAISHDITLAAAALSNTKQGTVVHLSNVTVDESKIGDKKAGFKYRFSAGASTKPSSIQLAAKVWDALPTWIDQGKILPAPSSTAFDGLDADKTNEVLDKYRDGVPVPDHVHIHLNH